MTKAITSADEDRHLQGHGVNWRLPVLLRWLEESKPDVVCLQELKSERFAMSLISAAISRAAAIV
ncbi:putative class III extradiol MEMO1 family dioxygenase [Rhizobium mongolense]|uniref:Class III extradiol MEMO1 family dioxygenase n=1 Tax=Rhizobium mongolense TaxID=57676 RepID=A0ABR6IPN4_9HYPH|nr:putative class III extradiol MEMO1 family dioxygenase [Rhizobium mongolense]